LQESRNVRTIIDYDRETITIRNLDALPRGLGASLLLVVESPYAGEYVAKRWLRKMPATTERCHAVIRFGNAPAELAKAS
jgi:hypothetical protein